MEVKAKEKAIKCRYHLSRDAYAVCQKYSTGYCEECFRSEACHCSNPKVYCDYRLQCMIWAMCEQGMD